MSKIKPYVLIFLRGLAMGAADVVPGVSGGTIAFITGIYEKLIDSIKSIGPETIKTLFTEGPAKAWNDINGSFLLVLFAGIAVSLFSLASIIEHALASYPILVWSFFWGFVLASVWHLLKQSKPWTPSLVFWILLGAVAAFAVSVARPVALPGYWWVMTLGGAIAICAMILPGVSGSFLLLLLGLYPVFIGALSDFNLVLLVSFAAGAGVGLLLFSRFLSWLLHNFKRPTLAVLTGFLLGSLNVIWPWKKVVETRIDRHGEEIPIVQQNLMPWQYSEQLSQPSLLGMAIVAALLGLLLVLGIEKLAESNSTQHD